MADEYRPDLTNPDLTKKERQVLRLIAEGWKDEQILAHLQIVRETLKSHRQSLYNKFGVHRHSSEDLGTSEKRDKEELIPKATRLGYLPTLRYTLEEKDTQLSSGSVETYKARASSYGYGKDKPVFYRRLLLDKQVSPERYQRFFHEVEILSLVDHRNILRLLDFGSDEEQHPFFTMPYHAGLDNIIEACSASPKMIDNILLQLLNVLAYLHWRGIIFNNLRPENVLVEEGKVFLINFGESLLFEPIQSHREISPNRKADSASETVPGGIASVQADLWALGILIYQVLTRGQYPFAAQSPTPERLARAIDELLHKHSVDEAMTRIVEKLLSFESEGRYQSALEVTKALLNSRGVRFDPGHAFSKWFTGFDRIELFGRDNELNQLKNALRLLVEERQGGMHLIVGELGVGKSVLIDQLKLEAWRYPGVIVSYAKAEQSRADDRGFILWRDVLSKLIEAAELTREVAQATKDLQSLLQPQKSKIVSIGGLDNDSTKNAALRLFRIMHPGKKIRNSLKNKEKINKGLKDKVVLLLLDDLQWMGEDSFTLLKVLNSLNLPVLIVGTCRTYDPTANITPKDISNKLKFSEKHIIKLESLNNESMLKLCNRLLSAFDLPQILTPAHLQELIGAVVEDCGGNPQLAKKFIEMCASIDGPESMRDLVRILQATDESSGYISKWLERLDSSTLFVLTTGAIVGRKFDLEVLRKIHYDQGQHHLEDLLLECANKGILVDMGNNQWEFEHESVYNAVLKLLPDNAESLYEKVARAFEDTYGEYITYAGQLGDLWNKAGFREKAVTYYLQATRFEISKSAYHTAKNNAEKILYGKLDAELPRRKQAEIKLIQYFVYMGLGEVDLALHSARNALDVLGYKIITDSPFRLSLVKASLKQIWYRLREGKSNRKKAMDIDEYREEFRIAVRCYRALAQLEYFRNNFWHVLYYLMEGLNLCDEIGDDGRGQKADIYAAATVITSPLGPRILSKLIASQYEELAQNDLSKSGDKALELWMSLVLGMYYCSIGKWNDAKKHLERGMQPGMEGIDLRRKYEIIAISYLCFWYCGEWDEARRKNDYLRELVTDDKLSPDSLSQIDLWPQLFDGDKYLSMGEFQRGEQVLRHVCFELDKRDQAAWLRGMGVLAQLYLRTGKLFDAEKTADEFLESVRDKPVMPFYATEGFFGALEVYLELLERDVKSRDYQSKIKMLLYILLDQSILAFSKRYPIARPRSFLYRARYVLATTSRKEKPKELADLALRYAEELKMLYDEGLIREFIGTYLCDDDSRHEQLKKAFDIFHQLGATWNRDRVGEKLK